MIQLNNLRKELTEVLNDELELVVGGGALGSIGGFRSLQSSVSLPDTRNFNSIDVKSTPGFVPNGATPYNTPFIVPSLPASVPPEFALQTLGFQAGDGKGNLLGVSPVEGIEFKREFKLGQ